jgi:hypothetical protein
VGVLGGVVGSITPGGIDDGPAVGIDGATGSSVVLLKPTVSTLLVHAEARAKHSASEILDTQSLPK